MAYHNECRDIENKYGTVVFNCALSDLFCKGSDRMCTVTEEEIERNVKGNAFMTDDFAQAIVKCEVELSRLGLFTTILPYIKHEMSFGDPYEARENYDLEEVM